MIPTSQTHLQTAVLSHAGLSGKKNEDRCAVASFQLDKNDPRLSTLGIIADGIGGHRAGEVAAELAVDYINMRVAESNARKPIKILENAVHDASQAIAQHSAGNEKEHGMGATCACVWVIENKLYTAYVGDSRIYLLRENYIQQLTVDHTWVQEALEKGLIAAEQMRDHPNAHVIRRHLGGIRLPEVDFRLRLDEKESAEASLNNQGFALKADDLILICTDGLTDLVWNDEIKDLILQAPSLDSAAQALVDTANQRGGHDNISVVLMKMPQTEEPTSAKKSLINWLFG
ncbi:MAG: protein phosphatase 2C domain-containing protein [Anaerolineales bacterium]|nr:protein phosphatase 2C domain-containing protein [Anaerolineales bacterium]